MFSYNDIKNLAQFISSGRDERAFTLDKVLTGLFDRMGWPAADVHVEFANTPPNETTVRGRIDLMVAKDKPRLRIDCAITPGKPAPNSAKFWHLQFGDYAQDVNNIDSDEQINAFYRGATREIARLTAEVVKRAAL